MDIQLIPIREEIDSVKKYLNTKFCINVFDNQNALYKKNGFHFPWIGYFSLFEEKVVGVGGFKYVPIDNKVELDFTTEESQVRKGFATALCSELIKIALNKNNKLIISAHTLMEEGPSQKILRKNNFKYNGIVTDEKLGFAWEWIYQGNL